MNALYYSRDLQHFPSSFLVKGFQEAADFFLRPFHFCVRGSGFDVSVSSQDHLLGRSGTARGFHSDEGWLDEAGHLQVSSEAQFTLN